MNAKLMAAFKASKAKRSAKVESIPASGSPGTPASETGVTEAKGPDYHHAQVRRHLEKGLASTRRSAKIHLKMAKYHHDCACGVTHAG